MANRLKEDEKHERIIRGLLKLPENRKCVNCNSMGPQYVCTNFWTFVCTTCSGIHREFTHRVKSVSMAKFTSQEVSALQEGGNKHARDVYFKELDSQRQSAPDNSNIDRLRDFIKHVYVDRRYTGERNSGKPLSTKMGEKEDTYDNRRNDAYQGGSRSPPYEDSYERRYSEMSSPGGRGEDRNSRYGYDGRRSPGYDQEVRQYNDNRRSPAHHEIISDWRREDRFQNGRKREDRLSSDGDSKLEGRSPERLKDPEASSPPLVRPVREILGDNVVPLRISEPPKANVTRTADGFAQTRRTASSSSLGSTNGNSVEVKVESTASLIDFDADPDPPVTSVQESQQTTPQSVIPPATSINDNNWASFDLAPKVNVTQTPSSMNQLESVISQLSTPASVPGHISQMPSSSGTPTIGSVSLLSNVGVSPVVPPGNTSVSSFATGAPAATPISNLSTLNPGGISVAAPGLAPNTPVISANSFVKPAETAQWSSVQHQQPSFFPASTGHSIVQQSTQLDGGSSNQPWNLLTTPNVQTSLPSRGAPNAFSSPIPAVSYAGLSQPPSADVKPSGRKELPEDLFTATYSTFNAPIPGWHTVLPHGMGFNMQYNNVVPSVPNLQSSRSSNPFDVNEPPPVQSLAFPPMASLQGALPEIPPAGLQHTSSVGTAMPAWSSSQSLPYVSALTSQSPPYVSAMPQRAYMVQQVPTNTLLSGHQGLNSDAAAFGTTTMDQRVHGLLCTQKMESPTLSAPTLRPDRVVKGVNKQGSCIEEK
ncbi:hypothetical protein K2173_013233 [Erythroxylum novogranatense]|uniref:Arf-GAP domain-containing protein n=1 Tax=Erythroxylum novogranatense TaxID=1862640 RepID=A0AAV8SCB8_9ROSI|nr:hypothetical protein K2173_013233 [Erythroxylum novogranatense]